jgi:hypothetical protein
LDTIVLATLIGLPLILLAALGALARRLRRSGRRAGPAALVLGNVLVLLTLLSLLLLGAEVWFRWFRDTTDSFGNTRACRRWYERHFHLNGSGFRDDIEYPARIEKGRRRLTILGDSFAARARAPRVTPRGRHPTGFTVGLVSPASLGPLPGGRGRPGVPGLGRAP